MECHEAIREVRVTYLAFHTWLVVNAQLTRTVATLHLAGSCHDASQVPVTVLRVPSVPPSLPLRRPRVAMMPAISQPSWRGWFSPAGPPAPGRGVSLASLGDSFPSPLLVHPSTVPLALQCRGIRRASGSPCGQGQWPACLAQAWHPAGTQELGSQEAGPGCPCLAPHLCPPHIWNPGPGRGNGRRASVAVAGPLLPLCRLAFPLQRGEQPDFLQPQPRGGSVASPEP